MRRALLRPDLQRSWEAMEKMPPGSVVIDQFGAAWQSSALGYWYRAYDGDGISAFEVAQSGPVRQIGDLS